MTTTLSLLKSGPEFQGLRQQLVFDRKLVPNPHREWLARVYTEWSKQFPDYDDLLNEIIIMEITWTFQTPDRHRLLTLAKCLDVVAYAGRAFKLGRDTDGKAGVGTANHTLDEMTAELLKTLENGRCDPAFTLGRRLLEALAAIEPDINEHQRSYLRSGLKNSFRAGLHIHKKYRSAQQLIPFEDYYTIRSAQSAWGYFIALAEYSVEYSIPQTLRFNEYVLRFYETSVRLGLAVEDYFTARSKLATNDPTNGVLSYAHTNRCSVQSALDYYRRCIDELDTECKSLVSAIRADPELCTKGLDDYIGCVVDTPAMFQQLSGHLFDFNYNDGDIFSPVWERLYESVVKNYHA